MISSARTLIIGGTNFTAPTFGLLRWPVAQPGDFSDYSIDVTDVMTDINDTISSVSLSISPWGVNELAVSALIVTGSVITAYLGGGVAGRTYSIQIDVTTASGLAFTYLVKLPIDLNDVAYPIPLSANLGYSAPFTWGTPSTTLILPAFGLVGAQLVSTGTTQATAFPLVALTNVFTVVAFGTGAILPGPPTTGTFRVFNLGGNALSVYPPVGAVIDNYATNTPVLIAHFQTVDFITLSAGTQWYAS